MDLKNKLKRIDKSKLSDKVYNELRDLLISGQVTPGERFSLRGLAETTGTSSMPVREAVGRLVAEHALEILPNRAIRVPLMTKSRFLELRTIRIRLEGLAISKAAANRSAAELKKMIEYERLFEFERQKKDPDGRVAVKINRNLHFSIYRSARMPILLKMIESLWLQIGPVLNYDLAMNADRLTNREAQIHHKNMVSAIKIKDAAAAEAALVSDLMSASELILLKKVLSDD